ncbi:hypothetical protein [Streptomyces sp. NPDC057877]|uniref:hypothetical protein n=1 Tax=Streptomyces sp. NPDC057877 TaxID=3346269 RepID=UPI00367B2DAC
MTAVIAFVAMVISCTGLLCAHQGAGPPPGARRLARTLRRPRPAWARGPLATRRIVRRTRQEPR